MRLAAAILGLWVVLAMGCGEEPAAEGPVGCRLNSDCPVGQRCEDGACVAACEDGGACCAEGAACPIGEVCNAEGRCEALECLSDLGCELGAVCSEGRCLVDVGADRDRDGVPDGTASQPVDNCPTEPNPEQDDVDGDGQGDRCDLDDDNDGVPDAVDRCPTVADARQRDADGDGLGNACDPDWAGVTLVGRLWTPDLPSPDYTAARVLVSTREAPVTPDGEGRFVVEGAVEDDGLVVLRVEWRGFLPVERSEWVEASAATRDLGDLEVRHESRLQGVRLTGLATLRGASSHGGTFVAVRDGGRNLLATLQTDEDGRFSALVSREELTLDLAHDGYEPLRDVPARWDADAGAFDLNDGAPIELVPRPTSVVTGAISSPLEIVDWTGRAFVSLFGEGTTRIAGVLPDGSFQFSGVEPGTYTVVVAARGHEDHQATIEALAGETIVSTVEAPWWLVPLAVPMRGTVRLSGAGEGESGGVLVQAWRGEVLADVTTSGAEGDFALEVTPEPHTLVLAHTGFVTVRVEVEWTGSAFAIPRGAPLMDSPLVLSPEARRDRDLDGVVDLLDNCESAPNAGQEDRDGDGQGDVCDADIDADGVANGIDNCPLAFNPMQEDTDGDGRGVVCSGATWDSPLAVACRIQGHRVDTRERTDGWQGSCGGAGAPEVVYRLFLQSGERVGVRVSARHNVALSLRHRDSGGEVGCANTREATFEALDSGYHDLVVDGIDATSAGPVEVDVWRARCLVEQPGQLAIPYRGAARDVVVADFDRDGLRDVAFASQDEHAVAIARGQSRGRFTIPWIEPTSDHPFRLAVGDFNEDGWPDLVTGHLGADILAPNVATVLIGRGDGTFRPAAELVVEGAARPVAPVFVGVADMDGDGHDDVLTGDFFGDVVQVLRGDGRGAFRLVAELPTAPEPIHVEPVDLDLDGDLDLVASSLAGGGGRLWLNDGSATFGSPVALDLGERAAAVRVADLDRDGFLDIVSINHLAGTVRVLYGTGPTTFEPAELLPVGGELTDLVVADINRDGNLDLLATDSVAGQVAVLLNRTASSGAATVRGWAPPRRFEAGRLPWSLAVADVVGDAAPDVLVANAGDAAIVAVLTGLGDGDLESRAVFAAGDRPEAMAGGDFDGDGALDLLITNAEADTATWLRGDGAGRFALASTIPVGASPVAVAVADLDGDGALDFATANQAPIQPGPHSTISVALQRGGSFIVQVVRVPHSPQDLTAADLDGDGDLDLVVAGLSERLAILPNQGAGTFSDADVQVIEAGFGPHRVRAADLDGDGTLELLTASRYSDRLVVLGRGAPTEPPWVIRQEVGTGGGPWRIAVADVNADGWLDVLTADQLSDAVSVMEGDGTGRLLPARHHPVGDSPWHLAVGDVDRDGYLDILTANIASHDVSVLPGGPAGQFGADRRLGVGYSPRAVVLGDFDGDARLDIAACNRGSDDVSVILSRREPYFEGVTALPTARRPEFVRAVDLDLDGSLDLLAASYVDNDEAGGAIEVYWGDGAGHFSPPDRQPGAGRGTAMAVTGDLDADGCPDIVAANSSSRQATLLLGTPAGPRCERRFEPQTLDIGEAAFAVLVADIDGDGAQDVAAANWVYGPRLFDEGSVTVRWGRGDGTFEGPTVLLTGRQPRSLIAADLDGDGTLDLATADEGGPVANSAWGSVSLLIQTAPRTFADRDLILTSASPQSLLVGDLDDDGWPDLVTPTFGWDQVGVLLAQGPGAYGDHLRVPLAGVSRRGELADLDADGRLDLLVALASLDQVAILPGRRDGRFGAPRLVPVGDNPLGLAVADLRNVGAHDLITANANDDTLTVLLGSAALPEPTREGTRYTGAAAPAPQLGDAGLDVAAAWNGQAHAVSVQATGRVSRLELEVMWPQAGPPSPIGPLRLVLAGVAGELAVDLEGGAPVSGEQGRVWWPRHHPDLARLEGAPLRGEWRVEGLPDAARVRLRFNHAPDDPGLECPAASAASLCPLDSLAWVEALPDDGLDLLVRPAQGTSFLPGSRLSFRAAPPVTAMTLHAWGGNAPLARSVAANGEQRLELTVPQGHGERYWRLRVTGTVAPSISVEVLPP